MPNSLKKPMKPRETPSERPLERDEAGNLQLDPAGELARIMWAEARGSGPEGARGVGEVVRNRVASPAFPNVASEVIREPQQFSALNPGDPNRQEFYGFAPGHPEWDTYYALAEEILSEPSGPTVGPTFYHATAMSKPPKWAKEKKKVAESGGHTFYASQGR